MIHSRMNHSKMKRAQKGYKNRSAKEKFQKINEIQKYETRQAKPLHFKHELLGGPGFQWDNPFHVATLFFAVSTGVIPVVVVFLYMLPRAGAQDFSVGNQVSNTHFNLFKNMNGTRDATLGAPPGSNIRTTSQALPPTSLPSGQVNVEQGASVQKNKQHKQQAVSSPSKKETTKKAYNIPDEESVHAKYESELAKLDSSRREEMLRFMNDLALKVKIVEKDLIQNMDDKPIDDFHPIYQRKDKRDEVIKHHLSHYQKINIHFQKQTFIDFLERPLSEKEKNKKYDDIEAEDMKVYADILNTLYQEVLLNPKELEYDGVWHAVREKDSGKIICQKIWLYETQNVRLQKIIDDQLDNMEMLVQNGREAFKHHFNSSNPIMIKEPYLHQDKDVLSVIEEGYQLLRSGLGKKHREMLYEYRKSDLSDFILQNIEAKFLPIIEIEESKTKNKILRKLVKKGFINDTKIDIEYQIRLTNLPEEFRGRLIELSGKMDHDVNLGFSSFERTFSGLLNDVEKVKNFNDLGFPLLRDGYSSFIDDGYKAKLFEIYQNDSDLLFGYIRGEFAELKIKFNTVYKKEVIKQLKIEHFTDGLFDGIISRAISEQSRLLEATVEKICKKVFINSDEMIAFLKKKKGSYFGHGTTRLIGMMGSILAITWAGVLITRQCYSMTQSAKKEDAEEKLLEIMRESLSDQPEKKKEDKATKRGKNRKRNPSYSLLKGKEKEKESDKKQAEEKKPDPLAEKLARKKEELQRISIQRIASQKKKEELLQSLKPFELEWQAIIERHSKEEANIRAEIDPVIKILEADCKKTSNLKTQRTLESRLKNLKRLKDNDPRDQFEAKNTEIREKIEEICNALKQSNFDAAKDGIKAVKDLVANHKVKLDGRYTAIDERTKNYRDMIKHDLATSQASTPTADPAGQPPASPPRILHNFCDYGMNYLAGLGNVSTKGVDDPRIEQDSAVASENALEPTAQHKPDETQSEKDREKSREGYVPDSVERKKDIKKLNKRLKKHGYEWRRPANEEISDKAKKSPNTVSKPNGSEKEQIPQVTQPQVTESQVTKCKERLFTLKRPKKDKHPAKDKPSVLLDVKVYRLFDLIERDFASFYPNTVQSAGKETFIGRRAFLYLIEKFCEICKETQTEYAANLNALRNLICYHPPSNADEVYDFALAFRDEYKKLNGIEEAVKCSYALMAALDQSDYFKNLLDNYVPLNAHLRDLEKLKDKPHNVELVEHILPKLKPLDAKISLNREINFLIDIYLENIDPLIKELGNLSLALKNTKAAIYYTCEFIILIMCTQIRTLELTGINEGELIRFRNFVAHVNDSVEIEDMHNFFAIALPQVIDFLKEHKVIASNENLEKFYKLQIEVSEKPSLNQPSLG